MKVVFNGPSYEGITRNVNDFWKLSSELKSELGKKGYYLDQYLSKVFETLARFDLVTVGEMASGICWQVQSDCYILCGTEEEKEKSEFFDVVQDYINNHSTEFNDRHAKVQFYAGNILIKHLNIFAEKVKLIYKKNSVKKIGEILNKLPSEDKKFMESHEMDAFNIAAIEQRHLYKQGYMDCIKLL